MIMILPLSLFRPVARTVASVTIGKSRLVRRWPHTLTTMTPFMVIFMTMFRMLMATMMMMAIPSVKL